MDVLDDVMENIMYIMADGGEKFQLQTGDVIIPGEKKEVYILTGYRPQSTSQVEFEVERGGETALKGKSPLGRYVVVVDDQDKFILDIWPKPAGHAPEYYRYKIMEDGTVSNGQVPSELLWRADEEMRKLLEAEKEERAVKKLPLLTLMSVSTQNRIVGCPMDIYYHLKIEDKKLTSYEGYNRTQIIRMLQLDAQIHEWAERNGVQVEGWDTISSLEVFPSSKWEPKILTSKGWLLVRKIIL